ncbi:MAG: hypothetical protein WCL70_12330 [Paludibacter sp.]
MKKEKALFFRDYMLTCTDTFFRILNDRNKNILTIVQEKPVNTNEEDFKKYFEEFIDEVKDNIREYSDVDFIDKYLTTCFNDYFDFHCFPEDIDIRIIETGYEVKFLKTLKQNLDTYHFELRNIYYGYDGNPISRPLQKMFDEIINPITVYEVEKIKITPENEPLRSISQKPEFDERFDFDKMMNECSAVAGNVLHKIDFIHNRIYDFKQWQIRYDEEDTFKFKFSKHESDYKYTSEYYPKFEQLCNLELQRLEKKLELEKKVLTHKAIENNPVVLQAVTTVQYQWAASGTDLLELVTALYQNKSIERKDGKALTRKELTEYFQTIFGLEIKDVEGKLTRATGRNANTPFLDKLAQEFRNYASEKMRKQSKRK